MTQFNIEVLAQRTDFGRGMEVGIVMDGAMAQPLVFTKEVSGLIDPPTIDAVYGQQFLQAALDCAWSMGLRPAGFHDVPQTMAATKFHLEDLRAIVFAKLEVEKPR